MAMSNEMDNEMDKVMEIEMYPERLASINASRSKFGIDRYERSYFDKHDTRITFVEWLKNDEEILWISGKPGATKWDSYEVHCRQPPNHAASRISPCKSYIDDLVLLPRPW